MKVKDVLKTVVWDMLNPFLLNLKKNKRYTFDSVLTGINIGCGIDNPPNWLGIDGGVTHLLVKKLPKPIASMFFGSFKMSTNYNFNEYYEKLNSFEFIHFELEYGVPFDDESIPNIYSSHFFEHLSKEDGDFLLQECYRVLQPGGIIRICVPSLDDQVMAIKEAIDRYEDGDIYKIQKYVTTNIVGYNSKYSNHRFMYNHTQLQNSLRRTGFTKIEKRAFKQGNIPNVEILDTRKGIYMEAGKT